MHKDVHYGIIILNNNTITLKCSVVKLIEKLSGYKIAHVICSHLLWIMQNYGKGPKISKTILKMVEQKEIFTLLAIKAY